MSNHTEQFQSWDDFLEAVQRPLQGRNPDLQVRSSRRESDRDGSTLVENWEDCLDLARKGWAEGAAESGALAERIDQQVAEQVFQTTFAWQYDVTGSEVDVARFLSGEPECMVESVPVKIAKQGRAVRLVVNIGASGATRTDRILRRGAAIVALADILARAQHPLEVWIVSRNKASQGDGRFVQCAARVQEADQPLDQDRLAYAVSHPSVLRRLVFSLRETLPAARSLGYDSITGSYGRSHTAKAEDLDLPGDHGETIVLPCFNDDDRQWGADEAARWIRGILDGMGLLD